MLGFHSICKWCLQNPIKIGQAKVLKISHWFCNMGLNTNTWKKNKKREIKRRLNIRDGKTRQAKLSSIKDHVLFLPTPDL